MGFLVGEMDRPAAERSAEDWLLWLLELWAAVVLGLTVGIGVALIVAQHRGLL